MSGELKLAGSCPLKNVLISILKCRKVKISQIENFLHLPETTTASKVIQELSNIFPEEYDNFEFMRPN